MDKITKDNIGTILLAGESQTVEFKSRISGARNNLPQIISAFANTEGGVIILGYDEGHRSVIGASMEQLEIVNRVLYANKLEDNCNVYTVPYDNKSLIIIQVEKSKSLVVVSGGAYIRDRKANNVLTSEDVVAWVKATDDTTESGLLKIIVQMSERLERMEKVQTQSLKELKEEMEEEKKRAWRIGITGIAVGIMGIVVTLVITIFKIPK